MCYQQMEDQFKTLIVLSHYLEVCVYSIIVPMDMHSLNVTTLYLYLHLQTGRFRHFWDEAAKHRNIVEAVPGDNGL